LTSIKNEAEQRSPAVTRKFLIAVLGLLTIGAACNDWCCCTTYVKYVYVDDELLIQAASVDPNISIKHYMYVDSERGARE